jgi:nicotinamidase-related amidase
MPYDPRNDLHGNVPDQSDVCLLIIDMINPFTFEGAQEMLPAALAAAEQIKVLKQRVKATGLPVIYVNDNSANGSPTSESWCSTAWTAHAEENGSPNY